MKYILCGAVAARRLIHKGLTPQGQPRKSTVDSYSSDGSVVGEYSIDKQYFSHLDKPEGNIKHALELHPMVKRLPVCQRSGISYGGYKNGKPLRTHAKAASN